MDQSEISGWKSRGWSVIVIADHSRSPSKTTTCTAKIDHGPADQSEHDPTDESEHDTVDESNDEFNKSKCSD